MNRLYFAFLILLTTGCASRETPAPTIVAAPTIIVAPTAIATATPIVVVAPPLVMSTATPGAESEARKSVILRGIARLKGASPEQDLAENWAAQNKKFVALRGAGMYIPGVPKNRVLALINKYDVTPIEGMTDVMEFQEEAELGRLALPYATRYNQLLLAKLDEQNTKTNSPLQ